jgi:hypothetical protein
MIVEQRLDLAPRSQISRTGLSTTGFSFRQTADAHPVSAAQSAFRPAGLVTSLADLVAFFGARVARQPMTTNAIRTATKIPNCSMSTMLILRRPEWGGIRSCEVTPAA